MTEGIGDRDDPPIIRVLARATGEPQVWGGDHADTRTCHALIADHVPAGRSPLSTRAWQSSRGHQVAHGTVGHGGPEWARAPESLTRPPHRTTLAVVQAFPQAYRFRTCAGASR